MFTSSRFTSRGGLYGMRGLMKFLNDFKALLAKGNAISLAVAVAIGLVVYGLAETINRAIISPLLAMITGGGEGITKLDLKYFRFGTLIEGVIHFAVALGVIYAVFALLLPRLGSSSSAESAPPPPPPPPAPPLV
jgi:large-conductance mechanosensitive channel